jgi:hypothetical protein
MASPRNLGHGLDGSRGTETAEELVFEHEEISTILPNVDNIVAKIIPDALALPTLFIIIFSFFN